MTTLRRVQFVTVLLHSAVLLWIVCRYMFVANPNDPKLGAELIPVFGLADIPATFVLLFLDQVTPDSLDSALAELFRGHVHPFGDRRFWVPLLCYGIIGTLWWWWVPAIIAWIWKRVEKVWKRMENFFLSRHERFPGGRLVNPPGFFVLHATTEGGNHPVLQTVIPRSGVESVGSIGRRQRLQSV